MRTQIINIKTNEIISKKEVLEIIRKDAANSNVSLSTLEYIEKYLFQMQDYEENDTLSLKHYCTSETISAALCTILCTIHQNELPKHSLLSFIHSIYNDHDIYFSIIDRLTAKQYALVYSK